MIPRTLAAAAICFLLALGLAAQDPVSSTDHPAGNVNELTLAGLRPGRDQIAAAVARLGRAFTHPSPDEKDLYVWCDARAHWQLSLEAGSDGTIQVVTANRVADPAPTCSAHLTANPSTGRGMRLGDPAQKLKQIYGKPFFAGPSSWNGHDVQLIVFNFSWAGADQPQILESSFDPSGHLVKITLSAQYY